jgi:acetyl-CoA carboxylase biotin carboxyl carrier protein
MNIDKDKVKDLAEILTAYGLTRLEASEGDFRLILEKAPVEPIQQVQPIQPVQPPQPAQPLASPQPRPTPSEDDIVDYDQLAQVVSPIVGVFYSAPSPDSPPYVSIGSAVRKGDVLCIIEAMKLLNEITADQDGEIVDICVKNGDIAEYGQVLFKMR